MTESERQPVLTDDERWAIAEAVGAYNFNDDDEQCARIAATLHGLLKKASKGTADGRENDQ